MKKTDLKKILVIHTGGTIVMLPKKGGTLKPGSDRTLHKRMMKLVPELSKIADISSEVLFNIDSSDMQPKHWRKIAHVVAKEMENFDGFVILHGTDTMAFTASALSFMLRNLPKPVILTGAQKPVSEIGTDARDNLINSIRFACMDIPEVCISFGDLLLRGNRSEKKSASSFLAFDSPNLKHLGTSGFEIKTSKEILKPSDDFKLMDKMKRKVYLIKLFPGFEPSYLDLLVDTGTKGVVIEAYGAGNVSTRFRSLIPSIKRATKKGVPVIICTQCTTGRVKMAAYHSGSEAAKAGAISAGDMTPEACITKLMHALGYTADIESIRRIFEENISGEMTLDQ